MSAPKNLIGVRFGRLVAVKKMPSRKTPSGCTVAVWLCKCACGNEKEILASSLLSGVTTSCGCYLKSILPYVSRRHGMAHTPFYRAWRSMINRCAFNENYNVRGISVCDRWLVFDNFMEDMLAGYSQHLSLDRIDNNAGYSKENCRWATTKEQVRNRRVTVMGTVFCETKPIAEWAELFGTPLERIAMRINRGWAHEKAILAPRFYRG